MLNKSKDPFLDYKKCDNIERTLIMRRFMNAKKSPAQVELQHRIKAFKERGNEDDPVPE